jgi:hypothetical protein
MYLFSCSAVAKKQLAEVAVGESMPFIVYIHYPDLFGAEHLCKLYLMQAGFHHIKVEKRQQVPDEQCLIMVENDDDVKEALEHGYCLRMFDAH